MQGGFGVDMLRRSIIFVEGEGFPFNPPAPAGAEHSAPSGAQALIQRTFLTKIPHLRRGVLIQITSPVRLSQL